MPIQKPVGQEIIRGYVKRKIEIAQVKGV